MSYKEIENEIGKIRRKYLESAEEIVSGFNREDSLSKDYEGRQMFELLQNADDAASGSSGKVLITYDGKTLSVSNTGDKFDTNGVKSLLYPNASPKRVHANKIGCKGLGFRSILTWTDAVCIATEDYTIQFSREYAKEFLSSILKERPSLINGIQQLTTEEWPIATLTCPRLMKQSALVSGYDTSIVMTCHEELSAEIESQIQSLEFEELIFLPNLKEIEIKCNNYHKSFYKVVEGNDVSIEAVNMNTGEKESAFWKLYKKTGTVKDEKDNHKEYEFIIAYDPEENATGGVLYSYFKTDVQLSFPALIHGTFVLTSDRNSLQKQNIVNKQLIPLLAEFMVQTAVQISKEQKECDYKPLMLVMASDTGIDYVLKNEYKFDELLLEKIKGAKILPTISDEYICMDDMPMFSSSELANILNPKKFTKLLKYSEYSNLDDYLKNTLGIGFYSFEEISELINGDLEYYNIESKANLIKLIDDEYYVDEDCVSFPHLLVDNNGNSVTGSAKVFPFPSEEQVISLPQWAEIKFLNQEMESILHTLFETGNNKRQLSNHLSYLNLEEYSFEKLLKSVVNQIDNDALTASQCLDILYWLWEYYRGHDNIQTIPDVKVKVICRDGTIHDAKDCYLGKEFNNDLGERLVSVYSDCFVSLKDSNISSNDANQVISFLQWIGVSKYPKLIKRTLTGKEKNEFLDTCFPLYVQYYNEWLNKSAFNSIGTTTVGCFEHLDILLKKADINDLLAWFIVDETINSRINTENESKNDFSSIKCTRYRREETVPSIYIKSYLRYYLANNDWIPDENGHKKSPKFCCLQDNSLEPFVIVPHIDYVLINKTVGRDCRREIDSVMSKLGIADVFQELDKRIIYQVLMKLPELDPNCKKARSLYRKLVKSKKSKSEYITDNPFYDEFIKSGSVVARKNNTKFYSPVSKVFYSDKKMYSQEILNEFNMFDMDTKAGEEIISTLFGVSPLKSKKVSLNSTPVIHPLNDLFKIDYRRYLPFVYACRIDLESAKKDLRTLNKSKLILCSYISVKYEFDDNSKVTELNAFESVCIKDTAYICVPLSYSTFDKLKNTFEFADAIAELITVFLNSVEDRAFYRDLYKESDGEREKRMSTDKGDDNLELLKEARLKIDSAFSYKEEFWLSIAQIKKIKNASKLASNPLEIIKRLNLPKEIEQGLNYDDLSSIDNIETIISLFRTLEIDVDMFNITSANSIDTTSYWKTRLKSKMQKYAKKYQTYIIDEYKSDENCIELYDQCMEEYTFLDPTIPNSINVDIDEIFENECGVSFTTLDKYDDNRPDQLIAAERSKISVDELNYLEKTYSPQKIEAYTVFGKIGDLLHPKETPTSKELNTEGTNPNLKEILADVFEAESTGLTSISTESVTVGLRSSKKGKNGSKRTHSPDADRQADELGIIGEAIVYKEILELYPNAKWVSGNAEKAGRTLKGDDTCGYDIIYVDENDITQYVEVKSSRSEDISFHISDGELKFGCEHSSSYEIIYVVVGEDNKAMHQPWRLGHLFEFKSGEDLLHNDRFSIESEKYYITAKNKS